MDKGVGGGEGGYIGSVGINSFFFSSFFFQRGKVLGFDYCYLQFLFIYLFILYYIIIYMVLGFTSLCFAWLRFWAVSLDLV